MPRKPQKIVKKVDHALWITEYLLYGIAKKADGTPSKKPLLWYPEFGENGGCLAANLREPWEAVKAELLPAWIREHPGTRPFAWWELDAPDPRDPGETEAEFLRRHGLLTPHEIKGIEK